MRKRLRAASHLTSVILASTKGRVATNLWQFLQEVPHLFFDYFVADFLKNCHGDTLPLRALLHVLPTPTSFPREAIWGLGW